MVLPEIGNQKSYQDVTDYIKEAKNKNIKPGIMSIYKSLGIK